MVVRPPFGGLAFGGVPAVAMAPSSLILPYWGGQPDVAHDRELPAVLDDPSREWTVHPRAIGLELDGLGPPSWRSPGPFVRASFLGGTLIPG